MSDKDNPPDDTVGYGRPPRATQFPKGTSGNPKGRPKGSLNSTTALQRELGRKVVIHENGRPKTVTVMEIATKQLTNQAAKGNLPAMKLMFGHLREDEQRQALEPPASPKPNETDEKLMKDLAKRYNRSQTRKRKKQND